MANTSKAKAKAAKLTLEDIDSVAGDIAVLTLERNKIKVEEDIQMQRIRVRYEPTLMEIDKQITERVQIVQAWADMHPEVFGKRRSIELSEATIGWRLGQPMLKPLAKWTWKRVTQTLENWTEMSRFLRRKVEPDKEKIMGEREELGPDVLRLMGLRVTQSESFFVDPKLSDLDGRQTIKEGQ